MSNEKLKTSKTEHLNFLIEALFGVTSIDKLENILYEFKKNTPKSPSHWVIRIKKETHVLGLQLKFINEGENPELDKLLDDSNCNFGIATEGLFHTNKTDAVN